VTCWSKHTGKKYLAAAVAEYLAVDEVDDGDGAGDAAPRAGERGGARGLVGREVGEDARERLGRESAQAVSVPVRRHGRRERCVRV
jgi:hypothetical protein